MISNALSCHSGGGTQLDIGSNEFKLESSGSVKSLVSTALCNYNAQLSLKEEIGGVWWVFRNFWFGNRLVKEEGVVVFPRLLWSNLGQVFIIVAMVYLWYYLSKSVAEMDDPIMEGLSRRR